MIKNINILLLLTVLVASCSFISIQKNKPQPEWITDQPDIKHAWVGIGYADKTDDRFRERAREKAQVEIAEQIKVQINSEFKDKTIESNFEVDSYTQYVIESRVNMMMEDARIIDFYETSGRYSVYMHLDKATYYQKLKSRKEKAIQVALDFMSNADRNLSIDSFDYLERAFNEIKPFLSMPLNVEYPAGTGKIVDISSAIRVLSKDLTNRISITSNLNDISIRIGEYSDTQIEVSCYDNRSNKPIPDLHLSATLGSVNHKEDSISLQQFATTDAEGKATFYISEILRNDPIQYFNIALETSKMRGHEFISKDVKTAVKINALQPLKTVIYSNMNEYVFGREVKNATLEPLIKDFFSTYYDARYTNNISESNIIIDVSVNVTPKSKKKNEYGLYQVYADATITISDSSTSQEIYQKSINSVQGADFSSLEGAARAALKKMSEKFKSQTFEEIKRSLEKK